MKYKCKKRKMMNLMSIYLISFIVFQLKLVLFVAFDIDNQSVQTTMDIKISCGTKAFRNVFNQSFA